MLADRDAVCGPFAIGIEWLEIDGRRVTAEPPNMGGRTANAIRDVGLRS